MASVYEALKEKGLALCYMKKMLGNDNQFHKVFKEWID